MRNLLFFASLYSIFFGVVCTHFTKPANATLIDDFSSWSGVFVQGNFNSQFSYYFEVQSRVNQTVNSGNRILVRPALKYFLSPQLSLWLGYGWTPHFTPFQNENRIWEQVSYVHDLGSWQLSHRMRIEQRLLDSTAGPAHRARYMFRALRFFDDTRTTALCLWDEFFYALNSMASFTSSGFDQNRVFLGLHFKLSDAVRLEPGYINVYMSRPSQLADLMVHALTFYVWVNL